MTTPNWARLLLAVIAMVALVACGDDSDRTGPDADGSSGGARKSGWTTELIEQLKVACLQNSSGLGSKADAYCSCTANRIAETYSVDRLRGGGSFDAPPIKAACARATGIQFH